MRRFNRSLAIVACMVLVQIAIAGLATADNIPIPGGKNKNAWDLATDPFTRFFGDYFFAIMIGVVTGVIWLRTRDIGPPLAWFVFSNAIVSILIPGDVAVFYMFCTILATVAIFVRALVK